MPASSWQAIRALRAAPTGLATGGDRRETYSAALRQAEELAEAAMTAGYASKPLPLFYALSQAGRAIAAAHLPTDWRLSKHGLSPLIDNQRLLETKVRPNASIRQNTRDSFSGVTAAINSPILAGPATIAELWAANPDLLDVPVPVMSSNPPKALVLVLDAGPRLPLPGSTETDPEKVTTSTGGYIGAPLATSCRTGADVTNLIQAFPTLRSAFPFKESVAVPAGPGDQVSRSWYGDGEYVAVHVNAPAEVSLAEYKRRQHALASITSDRVPPGMLTPLVGYALPEIAGGICPHPLLLWWGLLLALSSLARYEPAMWAAAIDPDRSTLAVSLERVLDTGLARVPQQILDVLA